jgi:segregation and condensation protein B
VSEDIGEDLSKESTTPAGSVREEEEESEIIPAWAPPPEKLLCALLFASQEYQNARTLREMLGEQWDLPRLRQLVKGLNRSLESMEMPFEVVETDGSFRMRTLPKYFPWVRKLFKDSVPRRLSQASLETLALVAYKQPITKAEIESIRGVNVDGSLKTLLDKKLIDIGKRSDGLGHAFTYHTTRDFLKYFGINRIPDDLPRLSEFEGILNAQSLIPQMGSDGEAREMQQPEPEAEQMSLGMGQADN